MPKRGSKTSTVPVVWATFGTFFRRRDPNDFLLRLVTVDEPWLYHYYPEAKQQSMEWRHIGSPRSKYSECRNSLEKFSARFFWDQDGILLLDYLAKSQAIKAEYYFSLLVQLKPRVTGQLQPTRNWPTWASNIFIFQPKPCIWPRQTTTCPMDWKISRRVAIFPPTRRSLVLRDLVGRTNFWFFLIDFQKLEQRAKKCFVHRGDKFE